MHHDIPTLTAEGFRAQHERRLAELEAKRARDEGGKSKAEVLTPAFEKYGITSRITWLRKSLRSSEEMLKKYQDRLVMLREKLAALEAERALMVEPQRRKMAQSGVRGVYPDDRNGKWRAFTGPRRKKYVGTYGTIQDAEAAIKVYEQRRKRA